MEPYYDLFEALIPELYQKLWLIVNPTAIVIFKFTITLLSLVLLALFIFDKNTKKVTFFPPSIERFQDSEVKQRGYRKKNRKRKKSPDK